MSARLPLLPALGMALGLSLAIPAHGTDLAGTWRFTHAFPPPGVLLWTEAPPSAASP